MASARRTSDLSHLSWSRSWDSQVKGALPVPGGKEDHYSAEGGMPRGIWTKALLSFLQCATTFFHNFPLFIRPSFILMSSDAYLMSQLRSFTGISKLREPKWHSHFLFSRYCFPPNFIQKGYHHPAVCSIWFLSLISQLYSPSCPCVLAYVYFKLI